jgi:sulfur carrier protein
MGNELRDSSPALQRIHINGDPLDVRQSCTVEALLVTLNMQNRRVAVALNRGIVPRSSYATVELSGGDRIEILEAVGGG